MIQYLLFAPLCFGLSEPLDDLFESAKENETKRFLALGPSPVHHKSIASKSNDFQGENCPLSSASMSACQEHAASACYDPTLSTAQSLEVQAHKISGLGPQAPLFSFHACNDQHCQSQACSNPLESSTKTACLSCIATCMYFCLINTHKLCMKRVCAATISAAVTKALKKSSADKLAESTKLSLVKLAEVQKRQLVDWKAQFVTADGDAEFCSDEAIIAADTNVVGQGGTTQTSALVSCANNYFTADRIASTVADPESFKSDFVCDLAQTCPKNLTAIALDRSETEWSKLQTLYTQRLDN